MDEENVSRVAIWTCLEEDAVLVMKIESEGVLIEFTVDLMEQGALGLASHMGKKAGTIAWSILRKMYEEGGDDKQTIEKAIDKWVDSKMDDMEEEITAMANETIVQEFAARLKKDGIKMIIGDEE